jgi:hypothetical protein
MNIDSLTEEALLDLHHRIVERLNMLRQLRAHVNMLQFRVGERVAFQADAGRIEGTLTRYNRKTVTVLTDDGHRWNVSPHFLQHASPPKKGAKSTKSLR